MEDIGELILVEHVNPRTRSRNIAVGEPEFVKNRSELGVNLARLWVADVVAVNIGVGILRLLEERPPVETRVHFRHRDGLAINIVVRDSPRGYATFVVVTVGESPDILVRALVRAWELLIAAGIVT